MGKVQGPKHRMCRRVGERLCSSEKCPSSRRQQPPGVHGPKGYGRLTEYGTQLREKQKTRFMYGVMEKQFRRYYDDASRQTGNTAENFLKNLETRLDNVVFRLGFSRTRAEARQMVSHGWVNVNGKRVTIPSYKVRVGEIISLDNGAAKDKRWKEVQESRQIPTTVSWLATEGAKPTGKVVSSPTKEDYPTNVNMTLVVEYYSR